MATTTAMGPDTGMAAAATEPMAAPGDGGLTDQALAQLMWLASPALPVGGFSYSEGLETAVAEGHVTSEASAARWLGDQLHLVLGRSELPLAAQAWRAWARWDSDSPTELRALNDWVLQTRESSEMRLQAEQMGRSLAVWLGQRWPGTPRAACLSGLPPAPTWPVAFALATWHTGAPLREALLAQAFSWAENQVQAALKAVPLGQSAGQRLLGQLVEALPAVLDHALSRAPAQRQAFSPMLAVLSARHEAQYSRLFRS